MVQQRKSASGASKKSSKDAAAPPLRTDLPDPAPFFSLGAAHFSDAIAVTKVISVVLPLRHLRDKSILHEAMIKKLLYRAFEPSADDLAQQQPEEHSASAPSSSPSSHNVAAAAAAASSTDGPQSPYVIVHIKAMEIHADTARQINPQGDVQVNVMTTLVAARVQHGLIAGVAEASPFATCMQVRMPSTAVSAAVAASEEDHTSTTGGLTLDSAVKEYPEEAEEARKKSAGAAAADGDCVPVTRQLRVTARCLEDEPVAPGQAVLLVSEPAAMRCLAIRPPRDAPGPFYFAEDTMMQVNGNEPAKRGRGGARKSKAAKEEEVKAAAATGRRVVVVACDTPAAADGDKKRPRS